MNKDEPTTVKNYTGLHVHSHYSLFDGVATPKEYIDRAKGLGMSALALTDHGTLSGHREFYRTAKEGGIKPILGLEGYMCDDISDRRDRSERSGEQDLLYNHIVLLAKNKVGLDNLNKISEISWTEGFFSKNRFDFEILKKYKEGIIVTSGCQTGAIAKALEEDEFALAKKHMEWFIDTFGEDFYVEVMPHNPQRINKALMDLADEYKVKIVVTPDCHHVDESQKEIQEFKLLLNSHTKIDKTAVFDKSKKVGNMLERLDYLYGKDRDFSYSKFTIHLLSYEEIKSAMEAQGFYREDMYENTLLISDSVEDYDLQDGLDLLPVQYLKPDEELRSLCLEGLSARGFSENQVYIDRINEELQIIKDKEFAPYFLVVQNMISWAKKENILVGPGRGSAAGSLICYALGITEIDPIVHGLLFFRFINPDRNDMPDIDTDIQDNRRDEVKDYLVRQYRHVASIATFLQFRGKGLVRDISRVLNIPLTDVNKALKNIETWDDFCSSKSTAEFREKYPEVEIYAEKLRGRIRGTGIHAAGVVTSKDPIFRFAPLETRSVTGASERIPVVGVDMEEAERIGLIKIDALGLITLSIIQDSIAMIEKNHRKKINLLEIPMDDAKVYEMLSFGYTKGVFQCEAAPYTNLLMKMGVRNLAELSASNALVRPGAMNTIGKDYVARKHGKQNVSYVHQIMKEFTSETYGCILYQEQVMQACVYLGGMSMSEADKVRKIIGKKKDATEFDKFRDTFVAGASVYISPNIAKDLWHSFEAHAGYSFNKSHAVAYSTLSYWTAWLKYHYPLEFMYSILKNEKDKDGRTEYLIEAKRMGITVKLPHINESDVDFKIEGNGIRFGLSAIKYISDKISHKYIEARPFASYEELVKFTNTKGNGVNSRALNSLRIIGAATFPDNPRNEKEIKENLYEFLNLPEFNASVPAHYYAFMSSAEDFEEKGSFIFMGMVKKIKRGEGWSRVDILDKTGSIGVFDDENTQIEVGKMNIMLVTDNRIVSYVPVSEIAESKSALLKFLGYRQLPYKNDEMFVVSFKPRTTKAGKKMATLTLADTERNLHAVTVFPTAFPKAYMNLEEGKAYTFGFGKTKDGTITLEDINV